MLFFFMLSNDTPVMTFCLSSADGDKPRKEHSLSISRPLSWNTFKHLIVSDSLCVENIFGESTTLRLSSNLVLLHSAHSYNLFILCTLLVIIITHRHTLYLDHVFIEHEVHIWISPFLFPPAVDVVVPQTKHNWNPQNKNEKQQQVFKRPSDKIKLSFNLHLIPLWVNFEPTFPLHEFVQVRVPVARFWLESMHAVKVEIGHNIVLRIASDVDYL